MRKNLFAKGVDEFTNVNYYINTKKFTNVNLKKKRRKQNGTKVYDGR